MERETMDFTGEMIVVGSGYSVVSSETASVLPSISLLVLEPP